MSEKLHQSAKRIENQDYSVWCEFGDLADKYDACNVGQGFPDFFPPSHLREALSIVASSEDPFIHQYTRGFGHPRLVKILAEVYSRLLGQKVDPFEEVLISVGAYGSLFSFHQGWINEGDEIIIIEPFFDCYEPMIRAAGGVPVAVSLIPPEMCGHVSSADWKIDAAELESKVTQKTKALILNNPLNPVGKVFTRDELMMISEVCIKHDLICVSDEVYEHIVYEPNQHIRIATLPGMWERTITIGSAGKTFSVTGWKVGWAIGPKLLMKPLCILHQNCTYTCPTPIQEATAIAFETELERLNTTQSYWNELRQLLLKKRDKMSRILREAGFVPTVPDGGYFILADISNIKFTEDKNNNESKDFQFVKWLTVNKRLSTIPTSVFYLPENKHLAKNLVRFCFMKEDSTIDRAAQIIDEWIAETK